MSQSVLKIIKGMLGLVIQEEWSALLEETHITVRFLSEIAHETVEKVCLPLQTLEFKDVGWGWQINDSCNLQRIDLDAIFGYHKGKQTSRLNAKNTFMQIEPYIIMTASQEYVSNMMRVLYFYHISYHYDIRIFN